MFEPRVALASLSGEADAAWAAAGAEYAGLAVLGGIALDDRTRAAAREMVTDRDRTEFLPSDPVAFVDEQLSALADVPIRPGFNVRTTTPEPLRDVAAVCRDHGAVLELNAHCRQDEMCMAGAGQSLLANPERLCAQVAVATETGATVGVKLRAEVPGVDLPAVARAAEAAGADLLHVDAMDSEAVIADLAAAVEGGAVDERGAAGDGESADETDDGLADLTLVANNGVRGRETVAEYAAHGADAVSVGRPTEDPPVLARVAEAVKAWRSGALRERGGEADPEPGASP